MRSDKICVAEASRTRVPREVEIIANTMSPPIYCTGKKTENINAPKPILDPASNKIGYPTSFTTSLVTFFSLLILESFWNCDI